MQIILNVKIFYYLWLLTNTVIIFLSGYMHKIAVSFLNMKWQTFLEIDEAFYIIDTMNLEVYDITDFLLFVLTPYVLYSVVSKLFFRKYRIAK